MNYKGKLSQEEWNAVKTLAKHPNPISLCTSLRGVIRALRDIEQYSVVGFDTESRPVFVKGERSELSLIQISTPHRTYLIRVCMLGIPEPLKAFLQNPAILKVGLSLRDDSSAIYRKAQFRPQGMVDLQQLCPAYGIYEKSLRKIYAILFDERISKTQQLTNWDSPTLTMSQKRYAALDAWACLRIFITLKAEPIPALERFGQVLFDE